MGQEIASSDEKNTHCSFPGELASPSSEGISLATSNENGHQNPTPGGVDLRGGAGRPLGTGPGPRPRPGTDKEFQAPVSSEPLLLVKCGSSTGPRVERTHHGLLLGSPYPRKDRSG